MIQDAHEGSTALHIAALKGNDLVCTAIVSLKVGLGRILEPVHAACPRAVSVPLSPSHASASLPVVCFIADVDWASRFQLRLRGF